MCAVPIILERIYKSILDTMHRKGWAAEELFDYFMRYKMKWQDRGFDTPILNKTVFRVIRYFLGGRVRLMLSGGDLFNDFGLMGETRKHKFQWFFNRWRSSPGANKPDRAGC